MGRLSCPVARTTSATIINVVSLAVAVTLMRPTSAQAGDLDLPDVTAHAGKVFFLSFQPHPIYGDPRVQIEVSLASGDPLPAWLIFNTTSRSLIGLPLSNVRSPLLLSVTSRCGLKHDDQSQTTSGPDQTCSTPRSDVFQITVTKLSLEHSWTPQPNLANPALHWWSPDGKVANQPPGGDYVCDGDRLIASLVVCVDGDHLQPRDRISLVASLAEFLTIPIMSILLEPSSTHSLVVIERGFQMVSAGPGSDDLCRLDQILEVVWPLPCSSVKHLTDFVRVLQHNVDGGRLQEELGHGVVGWYIASSNSLHTRQTRKRRAAPHRTLIPTPSIGLVKPTFVQDSSHYVSDEVLTTLAPTSTASSSAASMSAASMSSASTSTASMSAASSTASMSSASTSTSSMSTASLSTVSTLKSSSVQVPSVAASPETKSDQLSSEVLPSPILSSRASSSLPISLSDSSSYHLSTDSLIQASESVNKQGLLFTSPPLDRLPQTSIFLKDIVASTQQLLVASIQPHIGTSVMGPSKLTLEPTEISYISTHTFPAVGDVEFQKSFVTTTDFFADQRSTIIHHKSIQLDDVNVAGDSLGPSSPPTAHSVLTPASPRPHLVQTRIVEIIAPSRVPVYDHPELDSSASIVELAPSQSLILDTSTDEELSPGQSLHGVGSVRHPLVASPVVTPGFLSSRLAVASSFSEHPYPDVQTHEGFAHKDPPVLIESLTILHQIKTLTMDNYEDTVILSHSMATVNTSDIIASISKISADFIQVLSEPSTVLSVHPTWAEPSEPVTKTETLLPDTWSHTESRRVDSPEVISATLSSFPDMPSVVFTWDAAQPAAQPPGISEIILASLDPPVDGTHYTRTKDVQGASSEAQDHATVILDNISVLSSMPADSHIRLVGTTSGQIIPASSTPEASSMTVAVVPVQASSAKVMSTSPTTTTPRSSSTTTARSSSHTTMTPRTSSQTATAKATSPPTTANITKVTTKKTAPRFDTTPDSARTSDWTDITEDQLYINNRPYVKNPIPQIIGERGRVFKFAIPPEVFIDVEDGNTRSLRLSLELTPTQELPTNFWLYLDHGSQVLKGLPLPEDMGNLSVNLVATDSGGLSERTTITLLINGESPRDVTHRFNMSFDVDFQQFMRNRRNITNLAYRIGSYFGDTGAKYVTVLNVRQGSLRLFWINNTLSGTVCRKDAIIRLYQLLNKTNDLAAHLGQHLKLTQVGYELLGACSESPATTTPSMTTLKVGSTLAPGFSIWAHVILPVMIAFLVFVLIILIIIFCNRRRRHRQAVINAEKEAISNDRNPIIFPDEMDGDDPGLQAKDPLLLPTDPHPANQETPQTSPKTERDDDTDGRSRDSREQEWADAESRRKDEHKDKPRRHSKDGHRKHHRDKDSRKHSRDKDRMSGVSASSSLSFDRPNNHYLDEEEAGSRNSTLTSTKSGGSDKRHPKQPPPYWQSQSDPPPYRFPPPYLNNTTQV